MSRTMHVSLSVRGALKWPLRQLAGMMRDPETKRLLPALEARERLLDFLSRGVELLPMAECPGHDPKNGCPGHEEASP